ncbi:MBL fold metallo-hydrolase RNA specificity domain-containing protein [Arcticibacterium luteifluviistationis]|uniref:MBL fold hydrolase n=1 Tax=Arcticibacterium luteifluviistationis TaxID=1784714 RepID=A0A2Z4GCA5_9BACT|nr:MBL fold metallo-hydrolase [Arcticibacterium luteifluviistationis]AWV98665.1 MBL fold hydrolase [Arcticibacterium luteifluviistationis]
MKLSFFGAARQVTGSTFLLELDDDYRVLIDCGTDLSGKEKTEEPDDSFGLFPFDASMVNLVLLTHAHIDHSGQIPNLYREGYEGQVLCTEPTLELAEILLYDAASLYQRKLKAIEKNKKYSKKRRAVKSGPYYLSAQVNYAMDNFVPLAFNKRFKFKDNGWVTFLPAGHLLGAAHILIEVENNGKMESICFSGDIGRRNYPLLPDPYPVPEVDYLVCETTYGNREHEDDEVAEQRLKEIIQECCIEVPGRLIIPTFSVGRTQALLYTLNKLYDKHEIEPIKVFTDSPLARKSTEIHEKYSRYLNDEAKEIKRLDDTLFDFENLHYLKTNQESQSVAFHNEACIIISSSGMITGGRIEHHIAENIENPYATILFIGYATEGTIGHKLRNKELSELTIRGAKKDVNAKIRSTDVFSGHGDLEDLTYFAKQQNPEKLKKVFLVHGELESMLNFKTVLESEGFDNIQIPEKGEVFEI